MSDVVGLPTRLVGEGPRTLPQQRRFAYGRRNLLTRPSQGFAPMQLRCFLRSGRTNSRTRQEVRVIQILLKTGSRVIKS